MWHKAQDEVLVGLSDLLIEFSAKTADVHILKRSAVPLKRCLSAESHTDTGPLWNRSRGNLLHRDKRCVHLLND